MPNFRETDPSKIAVGFGGTLNLVAGLLFLVVTLALMVLPWHAMTGLAAGREIIKGGDPTSVTLLNPRGLAVVTAGVAGGLVTGATAVFIPLRMGARALRQMEF
jgi:ABC-2 type transport system permease protein